MAEGVNGLLPSGRSGLLGGWRVSLVDRGADDSVLEPAVRSFHFTFSLEGEGEDHIDAQKAHHLSPLDIGLICKVWVFYDLSFSKQCPLNLFLRLGRQPVGDCRLLGDSTSETRL